ncbi:hypothetical protein [Pedobacter cryoconitis]|uniref:Uncharacterized protein YdhG (YjbR/CyaY superfamily) n=1 Tax=Pedobacter cryoconitis TaxID=188932 RepID=A0A7X0J2L2_9SPHI|nr:hypothetical protein [Pedobacter cryoconitis]MBB6499554.1 uncharacterized protein YdhG (YjbR/CyaY superfamily) [Pedobacter cryoconitis]
MRAISSLSIAFGFSILLTACSSGSKKEKHTPENKLDVTKVKGIRYTEVKRRFSNGLSFDTAGFQQQPSWIIQFKSADTVLAYDPGQKIMQGFHLHHDHSNVFNFAKEWFRFKLISKDSLVFQRLQVTNKEIADDIRSDVNMTFYADDYIKNKLKTTAEKLQRPSRADTLFIQQMVARANKYPDNRDSVFAGRQPALLRPRDNRITVERLSGVDKLNGITESYDYLYPRYKLVIPDAYKDFAYEFNVLVDEKGKLTLSYFFTNLPEFRETRKKVLAGITSVYLQNLLLIKPGSTLGIPHASEITVTVTGRKRTK